MKRYLSILICGLGLMVSQVIAADITLDADLVAALPSGEFFLPAPPEIGSLAWMDDSTKYFQYKELSRHFDTDKQAYWDSIWAKMNEQYYFCLYRCGLDSVMNAPFMTVTWTKASATKYNVSYTRNTTDFPEMNKLEELCEKMKTQNTSNLWRTRPRPYYYFGDWYAGRKYAKDLTNADSYPSGHGYFAGLFGMCMLYIDPDNALAIKRTIDEWVHCRLILGAHWASDIVAGQYLGAMAFAIAMNYSQFHDQVEAAKAELETYRTTHPVQPTAAEHVSAEDESSTKLIENGQLIILNDEASYTAVGAKK